MTLREIEREVRVAGVKDIKVGWMWNDEGEMTVTARVWNGMGHWLRDYSISVSRTEWHAKTRYWARRKNLKAIQQSMYREMRDMLLRYAEEA